MRNILFGVVAALAAAGLPEIVAACDIGGETLVLMLERVELDGTELSDRSAYEGFQVELTAYGDSFEWVAKNGTEDFHAIYSASR